MKSADARKILANPVTRRQVIGGAGLLAGLVIAREMPLYAQDKTGLPSNPFTLGVASGDPLPDGVVLWTRLAPDPLNGGFLSSRSVAVTWIVALDSQMTQIVQRGSALAMPQAAHSIHVELFGLDPATVYYYQFRAGNYVSAIGRTKTAPAYGANVNQLKFAFCCCSDWQNGQFAAYRRMSEEDLDFVLQIGDYIYEYGPAQSTLAGRVHTTPVAGVNATQLTTLGDYRNRHAQYKTDPYLQENHRLFPWITVWDDHEVENNYANDLDEIGDILAGTGSSPADFLIQRAAAYQAYYEHMPLRRSSLPMGANMQLYRRLTFGNLLELNVLDTRQYRTDQPDDFSTPTGQALAPSDFRPSLPPGGNPTGYLMGDTQEAWLLGGLSASAARWNIIGNQTMMAQFNFGTFIPAAQGGPVIYNVDQWDGYGAARQRLLDFFAPRPEKNIIVLSGDIHSAWVHDLKASFANPASATVATEFICSSISADFPQSLWAPVEAAAAFASPWTKYLDARRRGYVVCTATPTQFRNDFRAVASSATGQVTDTNAAIVNTRSFVVNNGIPGAIAL